MYGEILTQQYLYDKYVIQQISGEIIANSIACSKQTVYRYLRKYNISIRTNSESHTKELHNFFNKKRPDHSKLMTGSTNSNYRGGKQVIKCDACQNNMIRFPSLICNINFCSKSCKSTYYKIYFSGINNPNYIDGRSRFPYTLEFSKQLKLQIRDRDNFTCQKCGITEQDNKKKHNEVLSVHHIDYNKQNCDKTNLITLCRICNSSANGNRGYWEVYYNNIVRR